jgi:lipopolysaccharide transport system permease protein
MSYTTETTADTAGRIQEDASLFSPPPLSEDNEDWTRIITPKRPWFDLKLREVWQYRDLLKLFTRRNLVAVYKQTILGPAWLVIGTLLSSGVFSIVFSRIGKIPTDGVPPFLFYMSGLVAWNFFKANLTACSDIFNKHKGLFSKVYFPRIIMPLSEMLASTFNFSVRLVLLAGVLIYFLWGGSPIRPNLFLLLVPLWLVQMAMIALGVGLIVSSFTTTYRDLTKLWTQIQGVWMWITPIVYPLSQVPETYRLVYCLNPMVAVIEGFKYAFLGKGVLSLTYTAMSLAVTAVLLIVGLLLFNQTENTFMDRV